MPGLRHDVHLTGVRKAAILTLMVGEDVASDDLQAPQRGRDRDDRARGRARSARSSPTNSAATLEEFHTMWRASEYVTRGGVEYAQKLLIKSLGPDMARRVLDRVVKSFESTMAFTEPRAGRSAAALEVHPERAPADDRAAPRAPQAGPGGAARQLAARGSARRGDHAHGDPRRDLARGDHARLVGHRAAAEVARQPGARVDTAASAPSPSCSTASIAASAPRCWRRSRASRRTWRCRSAT